MMARKKAEQIPAEDKKAKPSEVRQVIPEGKLRKLLGAARNAKEDMDSINGGLREKIAYAKEHDHLNTQVFATIRRLDRMSPEKLALWWDDFQHYFDISGLAKRAESAPSLELKPGAEDGEQPDNVATFPGTAAE